MIALQVKRNKDRFEFDVDANATVDDVFSSIEEKTNTLKRTMKLIVNGKTLTAFWRREEDIRRGGEEERE